MWTSTNYALWEDECVLLADKSERQKLNIGFPWWAICSALSTLFMTKYVTKDQFSFLIAEATSTEKSSYLLYYKLWPEGMDILKEYLNFSTIHGLPHISNPKVRKYDCYF